MFNAKEQIDKIIKFIKKYYQDNNLEGVVIGISGGKDSAVVAGLFTKALGPENVIGVTLPCHSSDEDKEDAKLISNYYGFRLINLDLTETFDSFKNVLLVSLLLKFSLKIVKHFFLKLLKEQIPIIVLIKWIIFSALIISATINKKSILRCLLVSKTKHITVRIPFNTK